MQKITIQIPEEGLEINGHIVKLVNKEKEAKRKRIISNVAIISLLILSMIGLVWLGHECAEKQFEAHIEYLEEEGYINRWYYYNIIIGRNRFYYNFNLICFFLILFKFIIKFKIKLNLRSGFYLNLIKIINLNKINISQDKIKIKNKF